MIATHPQTNIFFAAALDYKKVERELVFTAGADVNDSTCVNYSIIDDGIPEEMEDFHVIVSTDDGDRLRIQDTGVVLVNIIDDDGKCSSPLIAH